jgi:phospholipase C
MRRLSFIAAAIALATPLVATQSAHAAVQNLNDIQTVVVIYMENWSFDGLFARFPGANGISKATPAQFTQRDRDGSVLPGLPEEPS